MDIYIYYIWLVYSPNLDLDLDNTRLWLMIESLSMFQLHLDQVHFCGIDYYRDSDMYASFCRRYGKPDFIIFMHGGSW